MGIFYREKAFHAGKKIRKNDFAPSEKYACYAPVHTVKEKVRHIHLNSIGDTANTGSVFALIINIINTAAANNAPLQKITAGKKTVRSWSSEMSRLVKKKQKTKQKTKKERNKQTKTNKQTK